ncbi:DnaJ domain-containing protein [Parablautia muri]|uniref:DnaJ domain-containing protein n=1 Tax=Parablautia muri TaxID=2320879 RepID=UPI002FE6DBEE
MNTLEELRRQYKQLLKKYHPDNANGSTKATQKINAEYEQLLKGLKNRHETTIIIIEQKHINIIVKK